jgi:hypothetical protein
MAGYLSKAYRHAEKIKYYYDNAGERGYSQAKHHWSELTSLVFKARNSRKYKNEESVIYGIRQSMKQMMDEMKDRETRSDKK